MPTQLADILESPAATEWLSLATAVLVGAAATPESLAERAREAGIALITTYGMTETTGGCVYDGVPLPGVRVELDDDGRVDIIGPQVAAGYRGLPEETSESFTGTELDFAVEVCNAVTDVWEPTPDRPTTSTRQASTRRSRRY